MVSSRLVEHDEGERVAVPMAAGLCAGCAHARAVRNRRGSVFVLCEEAARDERLTRYPRLPVTACPGFEGGQT